MKRLISCFLSVIFLLVLIAGCSQTPPTASTVPQASNEPGTPKSEAPAIPTIPSETIKIVQEPYYPCTAASIGINKGWYNEIGITFDPAPNGTIITGDNTTNYISSQKGDMVDQPTVNIMGAIKDMPPVKTFVYDCVFYGSIVLGQPGTKSVQDFINEGKSVEEAKKLAVQQIQGKNWAFDGTASSNSFVTSVLSLGGLTTRDVTLMAYPDSEIQSMMLSKQVDFCGGMGLSTALDLMNKGMVPIIGAREIAESAKPSADSPELLTVFQVGWTTYDTYIKDNYDTILRFASVVWRQAKFINENPDEAASIQLPFMNSISGSQNTIDDMKNVYSYLVPYATFEDQAKWFNDPSYPLYYQYSIGAYINDWVNKGYLSQGEINVSDVCVADKVFADMLQLKSDSDANFIAADTAIKAGKAGDALTQAQQLLEKAKYYYDNYDFLDAKAFSAAAIEWANYSNTL